LPDVAGHVVEAVAVRREAAHRRGAFVAVSLQIDPRELPLQGVRHHPAARMLLIAPDERGTLDPAPRGKLPLGFGWRLLAGPRRASLDVLLGDANHRMPLTLGDVAARAFRVPTARTGNVGPPVAHLAEI